MTNNFSFFYHYCRTKSFKIGESSYFGIWKLTLEDGVRLHIEGIDWNSKEVMEIANFNLETFELYEVENFLDLKPNLSLLLLFHLFYNSNHAT